MCSCNIGEGGIALAEAVHGSAPDIAGKVSFINFFLVFHDLYPSYALSKCNALHYI